MKNSRLFAALIGLLWATAPLCANTVRTVALSDDLMPGTTSGEEFLTLRVPIINDAGQIAFLSGLGSVNVSLPDSYHQGHRAWSESSGTVSLVAGVGDVLPNAPNGLAIAYFNQFGFNNSGRMALRIGYPGTNSPFATYIQSSSGLEYISKTGDPAPGLPNHTFGPLGSFILNNASQIAVLCDVNLSAADRYASIWRQEIGAMGLVAKATNTFSSFGDPTLNDSGIIAYRGENTTVWAGQPGSVQTIAARGAQAPGMQSGESFFVLSDPVVNGAGHIAFSSSLNGSGGSGIWSTRSGALSMVARNGEQAPGTLEDTTFAQVTMPVLNDSDHVVFRGTLAGSEVTTTNDSGLWSDTSGSLQLIIREGDAAPGTSSGVLFGQFDINSHVLNADNQIAFLGRLTGTEVTTANDVGIWATDSTGEIQLIAREGNQLEVSPGDVRTIKELMFFSGTGNADSRPSGFNDAGQLAYWARFTDNSEGLFVSYLVAESIPGDFNHDGRVDSADYVAWRKTDGTQLGYNTWRTHFGLALPPTGVGAASIPEPATSVLAIACFGTLLLRDRLHRKGRKCRPT